MVADELSGATCTASGVADSTVPVAANAVANLQLRLAGVMDAVADASVQVLEVDNRLSGVTLGALGQFRRVTEGTGMVADFTATVGSVTPGGIGSVSFKLRGTATVRGDGVLARVGTTDTCTDDSTFHVI